MLPFAYIHRKPIEPCFHGPTSRVPFGTGPVYKTIVCPGRHKPTRDERASKECFDDLAGSVIIEIARRLVGMTKRSTVSTAQLRAFQPVHLRPINLVVYQGSFVLRQASLIFRGASHLDAFSGYPCRT